jgi:cystathionine beta-lyase
LSYLRANHAYLLKEINAIEGLEMLPLEATYLAWIDTRKSGITEVAKKLEAAGVGINDGTMFGKTGFIRLNFACPRSILEEVINRLKTVFV